jgi:hypothetical protein
VENRREMRLWGDSEKDGDDKEEKEDVSSLKGEKGSMEEEEEEGFYLQTL